jgi:hypothetical protein
MKHQRDLERLAEARMIAAAQISSLINALRHGVKLLDCEIATDLERSRCDPAYSNLAFGLTSRRDNLVSSLAALHERLEDYSAPINEVGKVDHTDLAWSRPG